jgi:hypothetical protein
MISVSKETDPEFTISSSAKGIDKDGNEFVVTMEPMNLTW